MMEGTDISFNFPVSAFVNNLYIYIYMYITILLMYAIQKFKEQDI